ncbi:hypothetical protein [Nostocoides sp. HKS02]|uniref:hypothetical protein n=1 Tax=Nostocoides sp. HKS02 TaxID=1813880 RepID=UPI0012B4F06C|nr:hypothetical protein [Tetrasphaera sp. HKS02]QGN58084.1 hypothetical protein GKE56_09490 [Tetrasphaera sp. HKS02]
MRDRAEAAEAARTVWAGLDDAGLMTAVLLAEEGWVGTSAELAKTAAAISVEVSHTR